MTKHNMKPVKELYYNAMKQVDDGRPGMALELGMNFFSDGNPALNVSFISFCRFRISYTITGNVTSTTDICVYTA